MTFCTTYRGSIYFEGYVVSKSKEPIRREIAYAPGPEPLVTPFATMDDVQNEYERNYSKYISYARLLTSNLMNAEDLVQQAFSNSVKQIKKGNQIHLETIGGYLKSTIRNLSIKTYRKESYQPKLRIVDELERSPDVLHLLSSDKKILMESISELIPSQRTIVILFYFDGMKVEEIASELKLSQSSVKTNLLRARKHLFKSVNRDPSFGEGENV